MKELTQEQKIKLAKVVGWLPTNELLTSFGFAEKEAENLFERVYEMVSDLGSWPIANDKLPPKLEDWNPDTNAEQFRELEEAYLNKFNVRCITYKYFDLPDNKSVVVAEYWVCEDGLWWFAKGKAETRQQASLNAMLNKEGK